MSFKLNFQNYSISNPLNFSSREEYLDMLTYQIENSFMKWSAMFGLMEVQKEILGIDDYSLGQTSLEQVFLFFTKNANNPPRNA